MQKSRIDQTFYRLAGCLLHRGLEAVAQSHDRC